MTRTPEKALKSSLGAVLTNVSNYPDDVQARLLGANLSKIIEQSVEAVLNSGLIEQVDTLHFRPDVTRVELIDDSGRAYTTHWAEDVMTSLQDDGRTLKIFLKKGGHGG